MLIYNSQTHRKEEFVPLEEGKVRMYVCGPTVYDQIHIGNARTFVSFDVIRRYLSYKGYQVTFAQNLTDVDDKIINRANEEGRSAFEVADEYSAAFIEQMHRFNVLDPDIRPRATREIDAMQEMIASLIDQGNAYVAHNGDVYFSVRSDHDYGTLSGRDLDQLRAGERVEVNDEKRDPFDFALWKAAKPGEPSWPSPWGDGRPGWHTECCAMIHRYLGTPIDIHGGGQDLVFPHHENETAQASCAWHAPLAKLWMHTGMLRVDGEKMSKSLGNFHTLREVLDRYPADAVRLLMLQTHYRSSLDFRFDLLDGSVGNVARLASCVRNLRWASKNAPQDGVFNEADRALSTAAKEAQAEFTRQMDDDFNTSGALAAVFGLVNAANKYLASVGGDLATAACLRAADTIQELMEVLGIDLAASAAADELPAELVGLAREHAAYGGADVQEAAEALLKARAAARADKNWPVADAIRDGIAALGLIVEDTAAGVRLRPAERG
ncbi:cysteine--tRNA ligase [Olsenella sp. HMSC062G07]|uniref:cysteine--tRNA ligase n=1 Tax=Olsenella sp. HMSC062G07 TaxID=1739330 RepID=UPI0008A58AE6|nr:cysteine--tRNA ligase [Olsenella sp. HMSC062G07]OFK22676.1 cysteine--tRNA ligase [Olsenella sp. HMSC062G07]